MRAVNKKEIELTPADLEIVLRAVAEKENPGYKVDDVHFEVRDVGGDYPDVVLSSVRITMKKEER
jgi:hypothetical protein